MACKKRTHSTLHTDIDELAVAKFAQNQNWMKIS